jgi:BioD-like phosphotransacetylase family protein
VAEDTYSVASKLRETVFKMTPEDRDRFNLAVSLVAKHVNVPAILEQLSN